MCDFELLERIRVLEDTIAKLIKKYNTHVHTMGGYFHATTEKPRN